MNTAVTATVAVKSLLDKPLHELTEDDISQLTREDCRRFLKEKGMRRPSWNKSQAIQQVISLKSLLEPSPPNAAASKPALRLPINPQALATNPETSNSSSSVKELSPVDAEGSASALAEEGGLNQPAGTSSSDPARDGQCHPSIIDFKAVPARSTEALHLPFDQMTILYSGKVNVYDGVPIDKARTIMHLAASPIQFCRDPNSGNSTHWSTTCQLPTSSVKFNVAIPHSSTMHSMRADDESQTDRQVSLQRYLEKRKDRGKFKMKRKIGSSGLEMYLNHQMRAPITNRQSNENNTSLTSQLRILCSSYGKMNEQPKNPGLSVNLNNKA